MRQSLNINNQKGKSLNPLVSAQTDSLDAALPEDILLAASNYAEEQRKKGLLIDNEQAYNIIAEKFEWK